MKITPEILSILKKSHRQAQIEGKKIDSQILAFSKLYGVHPRTVYKWLAAKGQ